MSAVKILALFGREKGCSRQARSPRPGRGPGPRDAACPGGASLPCARRSSPVFPEPDEREAVQLGALFHEEAAHHFLTPPAQGHVGPAAPRRRCSRPRPPCTWRCRPAASAHPASLLGGVGQLGSPHVERHLELLHLGARKGSWRPRPRPWPPRRRCAAGSLPIRVTSVPMWVASVAVALTEAISVVSLSTRPSSGP